MERGVSVEQCTYALSDCLQHANEIRKKHTLAVSGDFCVIPLLLQNLILLVT